MATGNMTKQAFDVAKNAKLPFGKYKGLTLNEAAETDEGLLYLDWLVGQEWLNPELARPIKDFLAYEPVARDVDVAIASRKGHRK